VTVYRCRKCGAEYRELPNLRRLHRGIADRLTQDLLPLSGPALRFLRKQMGLSTKELAEVMGVRRESVTRWETGAEPIGPTSDRLARLVYGVWRSAESGQPLPPHLQRVRDSLAAIQRKRTRRPPPLVLSAAAMTAR
jgi:transcriptional regulator with XRE-family HTH domain